VFKLLAILWTDDDSAFDRFAVSVQRCFLLPVLAASLELDHVTSILAVEPDLDIAYGLKEASHEVSGSYSRQQPLLLPYTQDSRKVGPTRIA